MKKILYILILGLTSIFSFSSCADWLDVAPKTDLPAEENFETENGFMSALAGLYISMTDDTSYGQELSFGLVEQLAQMYDKIPDGAKDRNNVYIYDTETTGGYNTKGTLANIWQKQYYIIANANNLMKWLDLNGEAVLTDTITRKMIRGEALAIRAFIHFDLLRGWGPMNYANDPEAKNMKCIPYRVVADNSKQPLLQAKVIVDKIIKDLEDAKELLSFEKDLDLSHYNSGDRHFRFNYHAVNATLARVHNYAGNKEKAKACALDVIKNSGRSLIDDNNGDPIMTNEVICGLSIHEMEEAMSEHFSDGEKIQTKNFIYLQTRELLFEAKTINEDIRAKSSAFIINNGLQVATTLKYIENDNEIIPLIRLAEMYYIACESSEGEDAAMYINNVRNKRGISKTNNINCNTEEDCINELKKEYRKEFYAEGQYFWFLKTHGLTGTLEHTVNNRDGDVTTTLVEENFVFPLPDREKEYGWTEGKEEENKD